VNGRPRRLATALAGLAIVALALTGCTTADSLADQYNAGDSKGYIAGDGSVTEIPADERGESVEFDGTLEDGSTISSADYAGEVLVVNFWYASCAPCRAEAPDLKEISEQFADNGASFLGVNVRDQAASAIAFNESYEISYPSVMDVDDGGMQLAFSGSIPPNAVPTTLVLDSSGRVAARILGQVNSPSILETLITDTIAEDG
jgi:thiol-disulfide isomerase/thioredoxin